MIRIGIDPSINCTGICVFDGKDNIYYMIPSKTTKKMETFSHNYIHINKYIKEDTNGKEYEDKEIAKTNNIYNICNTIQSIIKFYSLLDDIEIVMEGVSYGSVGSAALVDLSGLNFAIRMVLRNMDISFMIVSPTSVKKFAVANGQAEKDIMIDAWKRLDKNISDIKDIKIDDLADAYFLAHYEKM